MRHHEFVIATFDNLRQNGHQRLGNLFTRTECEQVRSLYDSGGHFRSRIEMARYRFGRGEYQYFGYPLPPLVEALRNSLYRDLVPAARQWMDELRIPANYPDELAEFIRMCHAAGQQRPTPLLLRYRAAAGASTEPAIAMA
jgi:hypothetical protein